MSCCGGTSTESTSARGPDAAAFADWMSQLPPELHAAPLNTLAIPGSHDSFTSFLKPDNGLAPNCPEFAKDLVKYLGSRAKEVLYNWSVTQSYTFAEQLKAGIRYFDLRITSKPDTVDLFMCHALYADNTVQEHMKEMKLFLDQHPKEVILLDFNHFYDMTSNHHEHLIDILLSVFGDKLCPLLDCESTSLQQLWENNLQVIIFYHNDIIHNHMEFWPGSFIPSPWGNVYSTGKLLSFLEENYQKGRPQDKFYVTQGILTPDAAYIMKHLMGTLQKDLADKVAAPLVQWLKTKKAGICGINVVIMDFIQLSDYVPSVIALNTV